MHIGFNFVVAGARNTGAREYLNNLLTEILKLEGPERYTVYFRRDESEDTIARIGALSSNVRCVRTPLPMTPTVTRVLRGELYWRNQVRADGIDVFHHTYFPLPRGIERRCSVVLTLYDLIQRGMPEAFTTGRRIFTNLTQPDAFRRADRVAVISESVVDDVVRYHPWVPREKLDVVPCAVDEVYIRHASAPTDASLARLVRQRYRLPDSYILGVGHLEPRKNWARLIAAYARLRDELGERAPELVIVGVENWHFDEIYAAASAERIRAHVHFTGYVETDHLPQVYSLATAFVYPSLYEGFGIPVLEGMASGVPVLTSTVTSLPEVAGGSACLVDPYSVDSIHRGLKRLVTDREYREELVRRGHENVKRYSWRKSAEAMREIYRELGARGPATAEAR